MTETLHRSPNRWVAVFWLLFLCLVTGTVGLGAQPAQQSTEDPGLFFDTVEVNLVNIEVLVTDRKGQPVTGLRKEDFEVFQDGEPVELTNFFAVEGRQPIQSREGELGAVPPTPETQRLNLVIYVDNFNIQPRNRNLIFEGVADYLHHSLDPRDRVMLVTYDGSVHVAQGFTNDPSPVLAELVRLRTSTGNRLSYDSDRRRLLTELERTPLNNREEENALASNLNFQYTLRQAQTLAGDVRILSERGHQRTRTTLAALRKFTDMLAGMRGRKAVLYISDGLHQRSGEALSQAWTNKFETWAIQNNASNILSEVTSLRSMPNDATQDFQDLVTHASTNRVAFYPISNAAQVGSGRISAQFSGVGTADGRGPRSLDVTTLEHMSLEGSLLEMAQGTGGLAYTRTANTAGLLEQMVRDFETFYSLGYTRPHETDDEFHRVEVKIRGKGKGDLLVRHLQGYREKDPLAHLKDLTLSALRLGIENNPLEVALAPGEQARAKGRHYRVPVMIKIPFKTLLLLPQDEFHVAQLTAFVIAQDDQGGVSSFQQIELPIRVPNDKILQAMEQTAAYPMELQMERGRKKLSVGIRDHLARVDSIVSVDLDVGEGGE